MVRLLIAIKDPLLVSFSVELLPEILRGSDYFKMAEEQNLTAETEDETFYYMLRGYQTPAPVSAGPATDPTRYLGPTENKSPTHLPLPIY